MTPRHYHSPSAPPSGRIRCPVCHETVYSPAGIHPQCAIRQAEAPGPKPKPVPPGVVVVREVVVVPEPAAAEG